MNSSGDATSIDLVGVDPDLLEPLAQLVLPGDQVLLALVDELEPFVDVDGDRASAREQRSPLPGAFGLALQVADLALELDGPPPQFRLALDVGMLPLGELLPEPLVDLARRLLDRVRGVLGRDQPRRRVGNDGGVRAPLRALAREQTEPEFRDLVLLRADGELLLLRLVRPDVLDDGDRAALHVLDLLVELLALRSFVVELTVEVLRLLDHRRRVELVALHAVEEPHQPTDDHLLALEDRRGGLVRGPGSPARFRLGASGRHDGRGRRAAGRLGRLDPLLHRAVVALDPLAERVRGILGRGRHVESPGALGPTDRTDPALDDPVVLDRPVRARGGGGAGRAADPLDVVGGDAEEFEPGLGQLPDRLDGRVAGLDQRLGGVGADAEGSRELSGLGGPGRRSRCRDSFRRAVRHIELGWRTSAPEGLNMWVPTAAPAGGENAREPAP